MNKVQGNSHFTSFFRIVFLFLSLTFSQKSIAQEDECLLKLKDVSGWGEGNCRQCSGNSANCYFIVRKNVCPQKKDVISMVQEVSGELKMFYKMGMAKGDTIHAFTCNSSGGKSYVWTRDAEVGVPMPTYEDYNADYIKSQKNNQIKQNDAKKRIDLFAKLLYGDPKKKPLVNQKVVLRSNKGDSMQTVTNEYGDFSFEKVNVEDSLELILGNNPVLAKIEKVYLAQQNGVVIQELKKNKANTFDYQLLSADIYKMSLMEEEDPFLKINDFKKSSKNEIIIADNIYFNQDSWEILSDAAKTLDKVVSFLKENQEVSVELMSYTDSKGDDVANMNLSEKRAQASVKYIVSKGVDISRVSGKGCGETKFLNRCLNGVDCSEKEHQLNRRIEFKFVKKTKKGI